MRNTLPLGTICFKNSATHLIYICLLLKIRRFKVANHKSAKKRIRQTETRRQNNKWKMSRVRTEIKKLRTFISEANKEAATKQLPVVQALLAKLAKTSALKKATAGRKIGRLASQVSKL